jgi:hypothetical protein
VHFTTFAPPGPSQQRNVKDALACDVGSGTGNCTNVVGGDRAAGELLIKQHGPVQYVVKTLFSDARCSAGSEVLQETFRVNDGSCLRFDAGSLQRFTRASGCRPGEVVTLRFASSDCSGPAKSFDTALTGAGSCFDARGEEGAQSYSLVVADAGSDGGPPAVTVPQLQGFVQNFYPGATECKNGRAKPAITSGPQWRRVNTQDMV